MPLFQQSVLRQYTGHLQKEEIKAKYQLFKDHFHNPEIQENILNAKEEEYQEGFVRDLFVNVLGYTLYPQPNYNFVLEKKTETDSTKSDGAILKLGKVIGVLELKDTYTTDLSKVERQAFGYKHRHPDCTYVITSNFQKLRFYINDAVEYIEFNLFTLTEEEFELLYTCLQYGNILKDLPALIKKSSLSEEASITKKLYADYSKFKKELFSNIATLNPQYDKLELFKKTQKLLDRFLFILFAEDRLLVPPNSVREIIRQWEKLKEFDSYEPLYKRFCKYFGYLNTGHEGKHHDIFAYNGGLFAPDDVLDTIIIDDDILYNATKILSDYDFESEVDVNILGHIFEHSLSEIEEVQAELEGTAVEKTKTKRKKDGVFYTPRYITKYIVESTVGELCRLKKEELNITDDEFAYRKRKDAREAKLKKLDDYRNWLFQITICDPACGSGAFLNQALEFLIAEHGYIDELRAKLFGDAMALSDVETTILENNLFGVDINDEAVEIAKLSLWLRTAQKGRKLNDLSSNIKCGNSLIDDPAVAGHKAFNWQQEFKAIFDKGGFDVVIGNPPYVFGGNDTISSLEKEYFKKSFKTGSGKVNLFTLFIEQSHEILKQFGEFSFIIPNTFLRVTSYYESRKFFIDSFDFRELADLGADVFQDAVTTAIILVATKNISKEPLDLKIIKDFTGSYTTINIDDIKSNGYIITTNTSGLKGVLLKKITLNSILLGEECSEMIFGVVITKNKDEVVSNFPVEGYKPFLEGRDITSYLIRGVHQYLNYSPQLLHRARTKDVFETPEKLLVQRITGGNRPLKVAYDNFGYYNKESINNIIIHPESKFNVKFILTLLNSSLINWFYNNQFTNESILTVNISKEYLSRIPIRLPESQLPFIQKADIMLSKNKELQEVQDRFIKLLQAKIETITISKKLQNWPSLSFKDFLKELSKQKIKLSLADEAEWMKYFEEQKTIANDIQQQLNKTDKEIDQMVYKLYDLTVEEIKIVEGNG